MNKETRIAIVVVGLIGVAAMFVFYKCLSASSTSQACLSFEERLLVASPFGKSMILCSATQWTDAIRFATKAMKKEPDNPALYYVRGEAYRCLERYGEAEQDFTKCIELAPDFANAYQGRAFCRSDQAQAILDEKKAIELAPTSEVCRVYLARSYERTGQPEQAKEEWKKLLDMNPDNPNERNFAAKGLGLPPPQPEGMRIVP